jgi:cell division protein FtsA
LDIGGGTTDLAVFERGSIWHTAVLPTGGEHVTNDLAVGLRTSVPDAEKLKKKHGCALASMIAEDESLEITPVGGRKPRVITRRTVSEIIQPRVEETFGLIQEEILRYRFEKSLNAGIVIVGGGAMLEGVSDIAEQVFDLPVRVGTPAGVRGLSDVVASPVYGTAVGLVLYGLSHREPKRRRRPAARWPFGAVSERMRHMLTALF